MDIPEELQLQVLGALLHDIGKLGQRAEAAKSQDLEGELCPAHQGYSSHKHVLYSDAFIEDENCLPLPKGFGAHQRSRLARIAAAHHKPANEPLEQIIHLADQRSAGADRIHGEESSGDYKTARLVSIFDQINLQQELGWGDIPEDKRHYYPLQAMTHGCFPTSLKEAQKTSYRDLYDALVQELSQIPQDLQFTPYLGTLLSLLEKYTWCIPASTYKTMPDISLYDHSTSTAAIAQALWSWQQKNPTTSLEQGQFLLVGGDLSGIQSYIFGLEKSHSAGVAKIFRARSFYLQMLTRSVVSELLQRLGLTQVAQIMDAGGRFVLLLPDNDQVQQTLQAFELELQQWFFEQFQGRLTVNLAYDTHISAEDMRQERFAQQLDACNQELEDKKLHKFQRLFAQQGANPIANLDYSQYLEGACAVCSIEPADPEASKAFARRHGTETAICPSCWHQIEYIGSKLPKDHLHFLVLEPGADDTATPLFGNLKMRFCKEVSSQQANQAREVLNLRERGLYSHHAVAGHMPTVSAEELANWYATGRINRQDQQYQFQQEPLHEGDPKTFALLGELARTPRTDKEALQGKPFIAAFKADVDNLGFIFSTGLGKRLSISRFTALSRMLNHFFTEELVHTIQQQQPNTYIVFAGGDDLFMLGPWREIADFGYTLRQEFGRYVCHNPHITLSAGITVAKANLPMHRLADTAEEHLDAYAKEYAGKNAVHLFGTTVDWPRYQQLLKQGHDFLSLLPGQDSATGKVSAGLIHRLLQYGDMARRFDQGQIRCGIYKSHMTYDIQRNICDKENEVKQQFKALLGDQQGKQNLYDIRLPVSYALYQWRSH